ncbi:MAG: iron ABC transporter substrate-binding protein [Pseudomonadota bacterium]|nr:iron ABC transporter substrate-binding protein [Pseudomonadota bacterium]
MMMTRRSALIGAASAMTVAACGSASPRPAGDVIAAGQPAALLIWAVARERLAGWPRKPSAMALAVLPSFAADLPELGALGGGGRPANLEALAALRPRLVIDYGDTDPENSALGDRMKTRLGVDWRLIDGALTRIPEAIREAGALLDADRAATGLAEEAARVLDRWRRARGGPTFYYARGADGLETGFRGALATEVLEGAGWTNVAEGSRDIGRVTREQVAAWDPEVLVTLNPAFAAETRRDPVWRTRRGGGRRRLLLLPDRPFGWVDRPPSVNRLLACAWLADPAGSPLALASLTRRLYGMAPVEVPLPRWID